MPIVGRSWIIRDATEYSPFTPSNPGEPKPVSISEPVGEAVTVTYEGESWKGTYDSVKDKVVVDPDPSTHWELTGSAIVDDRLTMYGMGWTTTVPDAMAAWVSDPQDA